ncbi:MAG TPA: hypothetical protein VGK59_23880 [Ohtaekwangia sp.]
MKLKRRQQPVKESRVVLYGDDKSQEIKSSKKKLKRSRRKVEVEPTHSFDTGQGNCGKICSCGEGQCRMNHNGVYPGDTGPSMGMCY